VQEDAIELAAAIGPTLARDVALRVQARMVAWALGAIPMPILEANAPGGPWARIAAAVDDVVAGRPHDAEVLGMLQRWHASQSPDWATQQAIEQMSDALTRVLAPGSGLEGFEPDLEATAFEIVRATGYWAWDEMLSEDVAYAGDRDGRQAAQEDERDRAQAAAHHALRAILRDAG
jgi:hypothetical protein